MRERCVCAINGLDANSMHQCCTSQLTLISAECTTQHYTSRATNYDELAAIS